MFFVDDFSRRFISGVGWEGSGSRVYLFFGSRFRKRNLDIGGV